MDASPATVCRALRRGQTSSVFLDGSGDAEASWIDGSLLAVQPELHFGSLEDLDRLLAARRAIGGGPDTGVVALLGYELFDTDPDPRNTEVEPPQLVVLTVDRSLRFPAPGKILLTERPGSAKLEIDELLQTITDREPPAPAARCAGRPATSLPRDEYLRSVERVQRHIGAGDIYQANLCQRFSVPFEGDVFGTYEELARISPAPHSAFVETPSFALASLSPETFLRIRAAGQIETWPIKGTRPRGATPEEDRAAADELLRSEKDRAELLMIVDLERNDLSRVCKPGSVEVTELAGLRSFPAVHHLVAGVRGALREETGVASIMRATFPGGSITGAPKIRAREILRELEPVRRSFFTGSLFWFGDDGRLDSSILIRSWVFREGRGFLGAGGGIVADSVPEQEWDESNHKARVLAQALGFEPEEAG